jgi:hypothetical protein
MPTTAHGEEKLVSPRELKGGKDVGHASAASDHGRPFVDHAIPDLAGCVVPIVARTEDLSAQTGDEGGDGVGIEDGESCRGRFADHDGVLLRWDGDYASKIETNSGSYLSSGGLLRSTPVTAARRS